MRLLAVALLPLLIVACANDALPSYVALAPVAEQAAPAVEPEPLPDEPETEPPPPEPERVRFLVMRLTDDLDIYQWPGADWQPFVRHRPNTLLLADGRTRTVDGELWLRLDMNNDVIGWVRQAETPLSESEVQALPAVQPAEFPTAKVEAAGGKIIKVTLLGQSVDGQRLVMRLPGTDQPLLVHRSDLNLDPDEWAGMATYEGPVWGEWRPPRQPPIVAVEARYGAEIHDRPNGAPSGFRLYQVSDTWGDVPRKQYAVLGRSLDSQWLAIRMDDFSPPVGWVQLESVDLNVEPESLPYFLSGDTEVVQLDADGNVVGDVHRAPRLYHWQWRDDGVLVGSNDGLWRWNPVLDEQPTQFAPPQWVVYSPDGRYAASGTSPDYENEDFTREITMTAVDTGESTTFVDAGAARFTHHDSDPSLQWSPDSRSLVARYWPDKEDDWSGVNVLTFDGAVTRFDRTVTGRFIRWLSDGTLLMDHASGLKVYSADGAILRELADVPDSFDRSESMQLLHWNDAERAWTLFDLATNESRALPRPLDSSEWSSNGSQRPLYYTAGHLTHFLRANGGDAVSSLVYDAERDVVIELPDVAVDTAVFTWLVQSHQWSDDGSHVAVVFADGHGVVFDIADRSLTSLSLPQGSEVEPRWYQENSIVDWSPDGRLILTKNKRRSSIYDENGVAAYPPPPGYVAAPWPEITEYLLIAAGTGQVVARFRANTDECWSAGHAAAFSPDGNWLAFSGRVNDCT